MDVVAVYGYNMPGPLTCNGDSSDASNKVGKTGLSADTMSRLDAVVGNTPMLDGKHVYNPDTCTPGTMTCGDCIRDESSTTSGWTRTARHTSTTTNSSSGWWTPPYPSRSSMP